MTNYPTSIYSPTTKSNGQDIDAAHINDIQAEVTAVETGLKNGLDHDLKFTDATYDIGKSGATRPRDLFISRNATVGGTVTVTGGQIVFPAAQAASADANTLDDYEEGTYTPADGSGAGLSFAVASGAYTKMGRMVYVAIDVTYPATADATAAQITLPFTAGAGGPSQVGGGIIAFTNVGATHTAYIASAGTGVLFFTNAGAAVSNATYSGKIARLMCVYHAAN